MNLGQLSSRGLSAGSSKISAAKQLDILFYLESTFGAHMFNWIPRTSRGMTVVYRNMEYNK